MLLLVMAGVRRVLRALPPAAPALPALRGRCSRVLQLLKELAVLLSALNVCLDPLIYLLFSQAFRSQLGLKNVFGAASSTANANVSANASANASANVSANESNKSLEGHSQGVL
ncbi:hypothetical protein WMY93_028115 [Mugilogobius chulae]|uniref:G-protein coupled receptors family 1 profile domain-containing protein n=1 Tax=Mugilogobius chulae TaxID=88201 RepID=A0AAW0MTP3_9GOBI